MPNFGLNATYGSFLYGSQKYGSTANTGGIINWAIEIDWDGDGVFNGTNEAIRFIDIDCTRGRKTYLQPNGRGFYPISPGICRITLNNYDGRYDPWNSSSPLYPNVTYGKDVKIRTIDMSTNISYDVIFGSITNIVPSGYGDNAIVKITIEDGIRFLHDNYYQLDFGVGYHPHEAIQFELTGVAWPARWNVNLDTSTSTLVQAATTGGNDSATDINTIASSFLGQFFIQANGTARYMARGTTAGSSSSYSSNILLKDIGNPFPWTNSRNITKVFTSTWLSTTISTSVYTSTSSNQRMFIFDAVYLGSTTEGDAAAAIVGPFLSGIRKTPIIKIVNRPSYQFPELFDTITLTISTLGIISEKFKVGGIEHIGTTQELTTILYLEPII